MQTVRANVAHFKRFVVIQFRWGVLTLEDSATAREVITAESGKPFPKGLPSVTMSGTTPSDSNAQK